MRCGKVKKLLPLYGDGRLTARQHAGVEEHLRGCEPCRAELAGLEEALGALRGLSELKAPVEFRRSIINGVRRAAHEAEAGRSARVPVFSTPRLAYAAAAVVLVIVGIAIGRLVWVPAPMPGPEAPVVVEVERGPRTHEVSPDEVEPQAAAPVPEPRRERTGTELVRYRPERSGPPAAREEDEGPTPAVPASPGPEEEPRRIVIQPREIEGPNSRKYLAGGVLVFKPLPSTETPEMGEAKVELVTSAVGGKAVEDRVEGLIDDEDVALKFLFEVFTETDWERVVDSTPGPPRGSS